MNKIKLDFEQAKAKHLLFKSRLRSVLYGMEIEEAPVVSVHECNVGKWIYEYALGQYGHIPEMLELEKVHTEIHRKAKELVDLYKAGKKIEAQKGLATMESIADRLVALLTEVEKKVSEDKPAYYKNQDILDFKPGELNDILTANIELDKRIQEQMRLTAEANERFSLLTKATHDVIWDWDLQTDALWWNESFEVVFGYERAEIEETIESWTNRLHPDDKDRVVETIHEVIDNGGEKWACEYRFKKKDGTYAFVFDRGFVLHNESHKAFRMVGSMIEITERKKREEAILSERKRLYQLFMQAPAIIAVLEGPDLIFDLANPQYMKLIGENRDILGKPLELALPEIRDQGFVEILDKVYQTGEAFHANECPVQLDKNGTGRLEEVYVNFVYQPYNDEEGKVQGILVHAVEVTDQVVARRKIEESESYYRKMADNTPVMTWITNKQAERVYFNKKWYEYTGLSPDESLKDHWISAIHPADVNNSLSIYKEAHENRKPFSFEHRIKTKDGSFRWATVSALPKYTANGEFDGFMGATTDIHPRKVAEEILQVQSEITKSITDNATTGLFIMNDRQHCTFMNPAAEKITGYSFQEIKELNKPLHDIIHYKKPDGSPYPIEECPIDRALPETNQTSGEDVFIRPDGSFYTVAFTASPIVREGTPIGTVIELRDITEEKRIKDKIEESEKRFRNLADHAPMIIYLVEPDETAHVSYFNKIWLDYTGQTFEEALGRAWDTIVHPDDFQMVMDNYVPAFKNRVEYGFEVRLKRFDGVYRWFMFKGVPRFFSNGDFIGFIGVGFDINDRKVAEDALQLQLLLTETIAQSVTSCLFMIDPEGRITYMNSAAEIVTGYTSEESIGKSIHSLIHHSYPDGSPYPESECPLVETYKNGKPNALHEEIFFRKNGEPFPALMTGTPIPGASGLRGTVVEFRDITEEKQSKEVLEESENRFRMMANNIQNLAWMANPDGWIFWYNERWYEYTGTTFEDMQGWGWAKVHHPSFVENVVNFVKEAWSKGEPFELTIPLRGKDGNYRWFLTRVFPVKDKHGKAIQWIGTNTDIDEQKRSEEILEEKVKKRTKELVKVNEELERSSYDLLQFASVASHDLKEPLRKIQSYSNLLLLRYKDKLDSTGQKYCQYLNEGGKRMKNLIDDILSYSKISSETLNFQQIDLNHLLSDIFYDLEILLKETNPKIEIGGLCEIECIPGQIRQVFQNLISNSLKFRKPDITPVITITGKVVKGEELDEKLEKGASYCKIEVKDNGIGFGMKYIEQIFTLFKRLHSKDEYAGTGIGLAIVKKIIEKHHGRITADSVLGEGALFTVILPIKQISD